MESMNNAPYYLEKARFGYRMGNSPLIDGMVHDGLLDIVNNYHMGYTAELVAEKFSVSRKDMDRFAVLSNSRAIDSSNKRLFQEEIIPVPVKKKSGEVVVDTDEGPRATTMAILAALKPAFKKDGTVTAGNASKISDGAAAMVLTEREKARSLGITPMARVVAQGAAGVPLEDVLVAPIESIPRVLQKARMTIGDIDLHEINEAFAASTIAIMRELDIPDRKTECAWRGNCPRAPHRRKRRAGAGDAALRHAQAQCPKSNGIALPGRRRGSKPYRGTG